VESDLTKPGANPEEAFNKKKIELQKLQGEVSAFGNDGSL